MYVCLCNAFTDRDVDRAIDAGAHTVGQVYKRLDAVPQCGKCKDTIRTMLTRRHATQSPLEAAQPRSEEHTSELQSLMRISYAVFCLKKKKHHNRNKNA